ncbi:sugar transporter [Sulfitobacter sp. KE29]|nr:sugar transporter [Magnetovibrio sp.]MDF3417386.1 sugar transporter [Sulfitobacter sp. Ks38]MDF3424868.1 sugar transporter [Sulfitobacter sp. KE29]MDF3428449.1 sugar transporter [Sulfitobacter sp. S46]MDF3443221.1 sugar transporter [Sulfitobacter sp. KE31]MDF3547246.1 sugar transporter [Sulfitobacter sp. KE28]
MVALTALAGCGSVYRSASVTSGISDGTNVRVVPISAETVVQANRSSYQPKTLPAVFSMTAGGGTLGRGAGALPQPTFDLETRPGALALRVPPAANPGAYQIGVGDVVLLSTPNTGSTVEELSGLLAAQNARQGYTVQDDGSINIPNVGRVRIAGLTIEDAEAALFQKLVENQFDPTFSLEIAEFNSRKVSIGGAVGNPGVVPVSLTPLYLGDALAAAGGVSVEDQDFASVRIYRDGTLYQIPLTTLYERGDLLRTRLVDGDAVFVDTEYELGQAQNYFEQQITLVSARQAARQAALNELQLEVNLRRGQLEEARQNYQTRIDLGADDRDYVYLTGEVGKQSRFPLPYDRKANLADAMFAQADGITVETGDVSQIYVLRASSDPREFGAVTAWHLDSRNAANYTLTTQFELRPNDIVFVAQQPITRWNRAVAQIMPSLISATNAATN